MRPSLCTGHDSSSNTGWQGPGRPDLRKPPVVVEPLLSHLGNSQWLLGESLLSHQHTALTDTHLQPLPQQWLLTPNLQENTPSSFSSYLFIYINVLLYLSFDFLFFLYLHSNYNHTHYLTILVTHDSMPHKVTHLSLGDEVHRQELGIMCHEGKEHHLRLARI